MRLLLLLFGVLLLAATFQPAVAQPFRARQGVQSGEVRSLDEIVNGIRRERPGSLADVQGPNSGPSGDPRYRLKWVTPDGRVLWLDTDARTGRVLGVEGDDRPGPPAPRSRFGFGQGRGITGGPEDLGTPEGPPRDFGRIRPRNFNQGQRPGSGEAPAQGQGRGRGFGQGRSPGFDGGPAEGFRRQRFDPDAGFGGGNFDRRGFGGGDGFNRGRDFGSSGGPPSRGRPGRFRDR